MASPRQSASRECRHPADDGSGRVCRRICAPGRDYHAGGHWYAAPHLDGERVRQATARWIVTGEQPKERTMKQRIIGQHFDDDNGNPAGGRTTGTGISIDWQDGPLGRGDERREPNGAFVEGVIQAAVDRLEYYQRSPFSCRENALAITKLQEALHWLQARTEAREAAGIEGTHAVG